MNRVIASPGVWEHCFMASAAVLSVCTTLFAMVFTETALRWNGATVSLQFEPFAATLVMVIFYTLFASQGEQEIRSKHRDNEFLLELMLDSCYTCLIVRLIASVLCGFLLVALWDKAALYNSLLLVAIVFFAAILALLLSSGYLDGRKMET